MEKFKVKITETLVRTIEVSAECGEEAIQKVGELMDNETIVLDAADYHDTDYMLLSPTGLDTTINVSWNTDDVIYRGSDRGITDMNLEDAAQILNKLSSHHDANVGISWEVIDAHTEMYFEDKRKSAQKTPLISDLQNWAETHFEISMHLTLFLQNIENNNISKKYNGILDKVAAEGSGYLKEKAYEWTNEFDGLYPAEYWNTAHQDGYLETIEKFVEQKLSEQ